MFTMSNRCRRITLRGLDNVVLTGHTGYVVKELYEMAYTQVAENVKSWMDGAPTRVLNDK